MKTSEEKPSYVGIVIAILMLLGVLFYALKNSGVIVKIEPNGGGEVLEEATSSAILK